MKKKRNTKSGSKITDFIIIIVGLIGIALSLYFFKNLLYKSLARENDVAVGTITFKRKSPRRKLQHESVWEYLKVQSVIYQGDYILTEDLSEAQLFFNDDNYSVEDQIGNVSHVYYNENEREQIKTGMAQIHANSMMRVGEDHLLHFISGSVSLSTGINSDDLSIQVGENIYTLDSKGELLKYSNGDNIGVSSSSLSMKSLGFFLASINSSSLKFFPFALALNLSAPK